ncbi:hypothetical protein PMAYCL1PPCAC_29154, partial [Pristionchus mayeri]
FAALVLFPFLFPSLLSFRTLLCCCGCTTKPCPEVPSLCPSPTAPCTALDNGPAIIDCNELQSLWDQAIVESAVESSEKDANMIHSLLTSPTAELTIAKMEKLLMASIEESIIDEDKESIRALMTVLRERMHREKSKEMRVRRSVIEGESSLFRSPPITPYKSGFAFRRRKRQTVVEDRMEEEMSEGAAKREEAKRDLIEQSTIGDGGASTKVNGGEGHSDVSLLPASDVAEGDHSHSSSKGKKEGGNCNDLKMRKMITDNIGKTPKESKKQIQKALEKGMGGTFSVVCSPCEFSFVVRSESYCDGFKNQIACFAYRDQEES